MRQWLHGLMLICAAAGAAEPVAKPESAPSTQSPPAAPARSEPIKPLVIRPDDLRKYMPPEEYRALLGGLDDERNIVLVQADAPLLPMKSELDVPGGILAPFWALANPTQAWRIFLPDPRIRIQDIPPPDTKIPPPVFRWGP
jgi:hypothetical protein